MSETENTEDLANTLGIEIPEATVPPVPDVISCDQLVYTLERMYQNISPGRDFLVMQMFDAEGRPRESAQIFKWEIMIPRPTPEEISLVWSRIKRDWEELQKPVVQDTPREITRVM